MNKFKNKMKSNLVKYTKDIPICPYCDKATRRSFKSATSTLLHFEQMYDDDGSPIFIKNL